MELTWLPYWQLSAFMYFNGILMYLIVSSIMSKLMDRPGYEKRKQADFRKSLLNLIGLQGIVMNLFFAWVIKWKPGKMYSSITDYSVAGTIINFVCFFALKDLGFYVIHRILHESETLYKYTHAVHHQCRPSNAFSAAASDFWDITITTLAPVYVAICVFPTHTTILYIALIGDFLWSHFVHSSCEIYLGAYINSPWHHNYHHQLGQKNKFFGLYTCIWDILFDDKSTERTIPPASEQQAK